MRTLPKFENPKSTFIIHNTTRTAIIMERILLTSGVIGITEFISQISKQTIIIKKIKPSSDIIHSYLKYETYVNYNLNILINTSTIIKNSIIAADHVTDLVSRIVTRLSISSVDFLSASICAK